MSLISRIRRYSSRHGMWRPDTRLIAAVSGGSDSVGMLCLLHDLHLRGELQLDAVAHLNHRIRPEADADEAFCRALAERFGISFAATTVDVPAAARAAGQSIEVAARDARRSFLRQVRLARGADIIATAHTADDQAETVLLRLMRGAGLRGVAGIAPTGRGRVRPVLGVTRVDLQNELRARGEGWREDATNRDLSNPRNRVRHELLPYLERHFNPSVQRVLGRTADAARADQALLDRMAVAACVNVMERTTTTVSLDADGVHALPEAVGRRVVQYALRLTQKRMPSHEDVRQAMARMEHFRGRWVLVQDPLAPFSLDLPVPGAVETAAGWIIEADWCDRPQAPLSTADSAQIDADAVTGQLTVRSRRPGDRLRPLGLGGTKKVQDVLVDRKVSRGERDHVPVVVDGTGRIVWVAGHVLGEDFRVTERTTGVIILKFRRI